MSQWMLVLGELPWILGCAGLLAICSDVAYTAGSLRRFWRLLRRHTNRQRLRLALGLVLLGGLLSAGRLAWQIVWAVCTLSFAGYLAWRWVGRTNEPSNRSSRSAAVPHPPERPSGQPAVAWIEAVVVALAAPALWFPTLRPQLTLLALAALLLVWVVVAVANGMLWPRTRFDLALCLLLTAAAVATLQTDFAVLTLPKAAGVLLGVAAFRAMLMLVRSRRGLLLALYLMLALALFFALVGLVNGLRPTKVSWLGQQLARLPRWVQSLPGAEGGRVSMNQLGGALLYVLPLALGVTLSSSARRTTTWGVSGWQRGIVLAFALTLGAALVLTQSRSAWFGLGAALLLILTLRWSWGPWAAIALLGGGLIWAWLQRDSLALWLGLARAQGTVTTAIGSLSLAGRVGIWERAVACIRAQPLAGCGFGAFRALYVDVLAAPSPFDVGMPHAHQVFLQVATDLGMPGLVAYLALLLLAWQQGWRAYRQSHGALRGLALGSLAALLGSHIYGLADVVALGSKPGVLWWLLLGLIAVFTRELELVSVSVREGQNERHGDSTY